MEQHHRILVTLPHREVVQADAIDVHKLAVEYRLALLRDDDERVEVRVSTAGAHVVLAIAPDGDLAAEVFFLRMLAGKYLPVPRLIAHDLSCALVPFTYALESYAGGAPLDRLDDVHLVFPRAKGMPATVSHPGQEHCYVLSGEVLFHVDGVAHRLKPGDGILIDSQLPHRAENAGRGQAHVLMTVARPAESSDVPDWWHLATSTEKEKARP